ncbi:AAA family ATPase [Macrococcus equi]|uniref:AAA family ATPase n=1 Tax=Macrococcus equi TaxID=3395462 RepID=UPI0039BE29C4
MFIGREKELRWLEEQYNSSKFEVFNPGLNAAQYSDFHSAFKYLGEQAKKERIILVIDEYPYLAESVKGISSILQRVIDEYFVNTQLFIILCGSSMSFIENKY